MKKLLLIIMSSLLIFAVVTPASSVDAKGRGGFKSPSGSFKQPTKPAKSTDNVSKTKPTTPTSPAANRGFFSGGGLMKGLLIGGIAGMLFGGMFGNMGALGNIFGFLINILAIYFLFVIIRKIVVYFIERRKTNEKRY
jgi:predicted lipid-binding transport protein (Tim44 family)